MLDLCAVLALAPLAVPLVAVLWALVRIGSPGPGFYGQPRVGRGGRSFRCWKLRSMTAGAEAALARHLAADPSAARQWAARQKLAHDPRVTRLGRLLRRTSLDELPQLWNVFRGEMSLVGPRPVTRGELARYGADAWAYLCCRPGLTGAWQVAGRNALSYAARVRLDVDYARRAGLATDLRILAATPRAVLRGPGM
jgi:lipopolysaccharide/colanic/teichoic acid biosynthesis glycosyltransferase